jgi:hypothetical protein
MSKQHLRPVLRAALIAVALATAVIATAGSLGLKADKARPHVKRLQPRLVTVEGVLQQDRLGNWTLDGEAPLRQSRDLRWIEERHGRDGSPAAGRTVRLTGQWYGGVFQIRHAVLVSPQRVAQRLMAPPVTEAGEDSEQLPE